MSLSQMSVRNLLTFSILLVSLFLFTQNTNAATFTVNDLGGDNAGGTCDTMVPIMCPCTDGSLTGCTIRAAADAAANTPDATNTINFAGGLAGILELDGNTIINVRDDSMAMPPTNLVINGSTAITITNTGGTNNPLLRVQNTIGNLNNK